MLDYPLLSAVGAVIREGSFERAAASLGVTPSAVSQRVKLLEERLGTILVVRGQPAVATEAGRLICRHLDHVGLLEAELRTSLPAVGTASSSARTTLRIAVNADSLGTWFVEALAAFSQGSPHLLDIVVDDQDHTADWLRKGEVIGAVTSIARPVQGCRSIPLGRLRYHATASPQFLARYFSDGVTADALGATPGLTYDKKDRLQETWTLAAFGKAIEHPTHWLPSTHAFVDAALSGLGWGMNPASLVADHLAAGRLAELKPGIVVDVALHWQVGRIAEPLVAGLTEAIRQTGRRRLLPST